MLPDNDEITRLRADLEDAVLPDLANILTVTRVSDGQGGFTETWGTAYTNVACKVSQFTQTSGGEQLSGGAIRPYTFWQFTFPHGTQLTAADRIEVGTVTYSVSAVDPGKSWSVCLRARGAKL